MGFYLGTTINYDPHQVISKRRHANNNKPFEHIEVDGIREVANWEDYPNKSPDNVSMEQDFVSSLPRNNSPPMDLSNIVVVAGNISSLMSFSWTSRKREHSDFMDIEEVDTPSTPKMQKTEQDGQMAQVKKSSMKGRKKQEHPKVTGL